jgi:hypothetical protein
MLRMVVVLNLVLTVSVVSYAQSSDAPQKPTREPVKTIKTGKVRFSYYERPDAVAASATFYINGSERTAQYKNFVGLTAYFANHGQNLLAPASVQFYLAATTYRDGCKYKDNHQLVIAADNKMLLSTDLSLGQASANEERCIELYAFSMPYEQFVQLTNAKKVEFNFGPKELKLTEDQLNALRTMLRGIGHY